MIEDSATDAENYYVSELGIEANTISSYNHISSFHNDLYNLYFLPMLVPIILCNYNST